MSTSVARVGGSIAAHAGANSDRPAPATTGFEGLLAALSADTTATAAPTDGDVTVEARRHGEAPTKSRGDDEADATAALQLLAQSIALNRLPESAPAPAAQMRATHDDAVSAAVADAPVFSAPTTPVAFATPSVAHVASEMAVAHAAATKLAGEQINASARMPLQRRDTETESTSAPTQLEKSKASPTLSTAPPTLQSAQAQRHAPAALAAADTRASMPAAPSIAIDNLASTAWSPRDASASPSPKRFALHGGATATQEETETSISPANANAMDAGNPAGPIARDSLATVLALGKADSLLVRRSGDSADAPTPTFAFLPNETGAAGQGIARTLLPGTPAFDPAAWSAALARHVGALARGGDGETRVTLEPLGLGPIEVSVRIENAQVDVRFSILHPVTQTLVRDALPALERLLGGSGLSLGQASVSQQQSGERESHAKTASSSRSTREIDNIEAPSTAEPQRRSHVPAGLLDDFV